MRCTWSVRDLKGALVTIDAMGCQTEIAGKIREREGDYLLAAKENQLHLYEDIDRLALAALERDYDAQFARDHGRELADALGFTHRKLPCKATLSNLFRRMDVLAVEDALARWIRLRHPDFGEQLALDGKTLRGSKDGEAPGVHLLALYAPEVAGVVAQIRVDGKTNEHKAALELLGVLDLEGHVVSADAMFCHRDFCQTVIDRKGDYLVTVKDNQPTLHFQIAAMFSESEAFSPLPATMF